jgi:hypothetical protein
VAVNVGKKSVAFFPPSRAVWLVACAMYSCASIAMGVFGLTAFSNGDIPLIFWISFWLLEFQALVIFISSCLVALMRADLYETYTPRSIAPYVPFWWLLRLAVISRKKKQGEEITPWQGSAKHAIIAGLLSIAVGSLLVILGVIGLAKVGLVSLVLIVVGVSAAVLGVVGIIRADDARPEDFRFMNGVRSPFWFFEPLARRSRKQSE